MPKWHVTLRVENVYEFAQVEADSAEAAYEKVVDTFEKSRPVEPDSSHYDRDTCDVEPAMSFTPAIPPGCDVFRTSDGYRLYRHRDGKYRDALEGNPVDMTFDAGPDGHPVDECGAELEGDFGE